MKKNPLISIITVSYNAASVIENTILSVINQTYSNIEYIIIDGGSTDGTIDIIKKYANKITYWISESDNGIYDAMNKGIRIATGEWVNFMNCGDSFCNNLVIEEIFGNYKQEADIIYGNTNILLSVGEYIKKGEKVTCQNYMPFGHQASFVRKELMRKYGFDTQYKICADKNFFYLAYKNHAKYKYIDINVSNYEAEEGMSSINMPRLLLETGLIEGKTKSFYWKFNYYFLVVIFKIKLITKKILPKSFIQRIRRFNAKRIFPLFL